MSKAYHKKISVTLANTTNQVAGSLDITNCNGVSVQMTTAAGASGSMKLQESNDNTTWSDIASATATISGAGANIINVASRYTGHVRLLVTLSAGAGAYDVFFLGKER